MNWEVWAVPVSAVVTAAIAWVFRYKIAALGSKASPRPPQEVLFEGYEKLLKNYQGAIVERDVKIEKLEKAFTQLQAELNKAHELLQQMREDNQQKAQLISNLEQQLIRLKNVKPE